jgi:hypothetical protein
MALVKQILLLVSRAKNRIILIHFNKNLQCLTWKKICPRSDTTSYRQMDGKTDACGFLSRRAISIL